MAMVKHQYQKQCRKEQGLFYLIGYSSLLREIEAETQARIEAETTRNHSYCAWGSQSAASLI